MSNLKKLESQHGFVESISKKGTNEKLNFFNLGIENNFKKLLSEDLVNKMNDLFQDELVKFKYE